MTTRYDVLIVGAGPTGLVLALWLTKQGLRVRIVDKTDGPGSTSRAMAVQARTLELYRQLDIAESVVAAGRRNPAMNLWVRGERRARLSFGDAGADLTPYPFLLVYPQDHHERLLAERLKSLGVVVDRQTELVRFEDRGDHVVGHLRQNDSDEFCEARIIAGCDGARSTVRHLIGAQFEGGTYNRTFYVADVDFRGPAANGEAHISLEHSDFVGLMAYGAAGQGRLIGTIRDERPDGAASELTFADVSDRALTALRLDIRKVNWFSTYRVHHRVADRYRKGAAFLLGDAAHIHSPAGGQGMNTGIGDAINLAWKIVAVLKGNAPVQLLDSYQIERQAFARRLVDTTDRVFSLATADCPLADFVRTRLAPLVAPLAYRIEAVREVAFRVLSQTMVNYRESPLSHGVAGDVRGGDRVPFVRWNGRDNYGPLSAIAWQVHVYGTAIPALATWCGSRGIPLHQFEWHPAHDTAGLVENAAYLIRPDTYVAVAERAGDPSAFGRYFDEIGIRCERKSA
jgi:2-polyprenyl-6-methoxyphenol hydroxylase-like FAD-dependent oxidoreductase